MSQLLARILLSVFLIPLSGVVYLSAYFVGHRIIWANRMFGWQEQLLLAAGLVTWAFMAVYWTVLWRSVIHWTSSRIFRTVACAVVAALIAMGVGFFTGRSIGDEVAFFMTSITAPILWLAGTVPIWAETKRERAERLRNANSNAVVCPTCGYNLTGLTESRCPECGSKFTLNDLLAAQPARRMAEIEND